MWECKKCHERLEESFEVCWNCGTSKDGVEDPSFRKADDHKSGTAEVPIESDKEETAAEPVDLDSQLAQRFRCPKCKNRGASVKRFAATGTGLSRLFDIQHNQFIAVSCARCGFTELYSPEILERQGMLMNILDLLFGG